jgi:hypothetical protein
MNKTRQPEKFLATFREVSHRLSAHGVVHGANLIFNHPGETRETIEETYAFMDEELARGQSTLIWTCNNFSHFPGSFVDNNRSYYEQKYGTEFLCPEWWKIDEDQNETSRRVVPSSDLSGDRVNLWQEMLQDRDQRMRDSLTPEALSLAANIMYPGWKNDPKYVEV